MDNLNIIIEELVELNNFKTKAMSVINDLYVRVGNLEKENAELKNALQASKKVKMKDITPDVLKSLTEAINAKYSHSEPPSVSLYNNYISITIGKCTSSEWMASEKQVGYIGKMVSKYSELTGIGKYDAMAIIDVIKESHIPKPQIKVIVK